MDQKTKDDIEVTIAKLRGMGVAGSGEAYHVNPAKESAIREMLVELVEIAKDEKKTHDYVKPADTKPGTEFASVHVNRQIEEHRKRHGLDAETWPPKEDPLKSDPQVAEQSETARENELAGAGPSDAVTEPAEFDERNLESPSDRGELGSPEPISDKPVAEGPINEHPLTLGEVEPELAPTHEPVAGENVNKGPDCIEEKKDGE